MNVTAEQAAAIAAQWNEYADEANQIDADSPKAYALAAQAAGAFAGQESDEEPVA